MKNYKINLTILVFILILIWISAFFYFNNTDTLDNNLNNNELFVEKIDIDFNSLEQEDE